MSASQVGAGGQLRAAVGAHLTHGGTPPFEPPDNSPDCGTHRSSAYRIMTLELRRPRAAPLTVLWFLQTAGALVFASYFLFGLIGLCSLTFCVAVGLVSASKAIVATTAYLVSIAVWRPQYARGWPFHWFLYSRMVDWVLGYHDATCIREGEAPDPSGRYLFAMCPHGVFGVCRSFSGGSLWRELFPGIAARWGSFGGAFFLPGVREFSLSCGCLDAGRPTLTRAIKRSENIMLLPGGSRELLLTDGASNVTKLVLRDRTGFVRLAIEHGMDLVPGFCFGEKVSDDAYAGDHVLCTCTRRTCGRGIHAARSASAAVHRVRCGSTPLPCDLSGLEVGACSILACSYYTATRSSGRRLVMRA